VTSDCDHGPITTNVALKHELRAGKFWRLGIVDSMQQCIEMCCKKEDCEMAYMPGNHCYGVDCFSEKHCEVTGIKPNVNLTVNIATVRPIVENTGASRMCKYTQCESLLSYKFGLENNLLAFIRSSIHSFIFRTIIYSDIRSFVIVCCFIH